LKWSRTAELNMVASTDCTTRSAAGGTSLHTFRDDGENGIFSIND
jgi:hypothetical protein